MREAFTDWEPTARNTKALLAHSISVINEYTAQGYQLTLRQLYYQLVARDLIPNQQKWYKRVGDVVTKGRMAGWIDWAAIVDRGRVPVMPSQWDGPAELLEIAAQQYRVDRWEGQENHVEVWVEKDALMSVLEPVGDRMHVHLLACRGYASATAMYDAAKRLEAAERDGQRPVVIYLGDHDPSGLDMSRDIQQRLLTMTGFYCDIEVQRIALNFQQVVDYNPPPNPTKVTDSRAASYIREYGMESWELDALEPAVLDQMVTEAVEGLRDDALWREKMGVESEHVAAIRQAARIVAETASS